MGFTITGGTGRFARATGRVWAHFEVTPFQRPPIIAERLEGVSWGYIRYELERRSTAAGWAKDGCSAALMTGCYETALRTVAENAPEPPIGRQTDRKTTHAATKPDRWRAADAVLGQR